MLTFSHRRYCSLVSAYEKTGNAPFSCGEAGALNLLQLTAGNCARPAGAFIGPGLPLGPGHLILSAGPILIQPEKPVSHCSITGLALGGEAALEAASTLPGPLVLTPRALPSAEEVMSLLLSGRVKPGSTQESALCFGLLCAFDPLTVKEEPNSLVARAVAKIREHYSEVYGVEELAQSLEVSKSHLIRRFTAEFGMSPGRYLTAVRVEAAKRYLLNGGYTLEAIARLCGFSGANYLCRVFKKEVGVSPVTWRNDNAPAFLFTSIDLEIDGALASS